MKLFTFLLLVSNCLAVPTTYYIDCVSGNDSNNGITKATPWLHAPGMQGTVLNVGPGTIDIANGNGGMNCGASTCTLAGYSFIFKGGVACPASFFKWTIREQGTGNVIGSTAVYFGVDKTWYTGASWTRPIFDLTGYSSGVSGTAIQSSPAQYYIIDNFEWYNFQVTTPCSTGANWYNMGSATNLEFKNLYVHHSVHASADNPPTYGDCHIVLNLTADPGTSVHDSYFDNSDSTCDMAAVIWGGGADVYNNYFNCFVTDVIQTRAAGNGVFVKIHQNTFTNTSVSFSASPLHTNCMESNADQGYLIYNNYAQHGRSGYCFAWRTDSGFTTYVWNEVHVDVEPGEDFVMDSSANPGGTAGFVMYNSTVELGLTGTNPAGQMGCNPTSVGCSFTNVMFISSASPLFVAEGGGACSNCTATTNIQKSESIWNSLNYTIGSIGSPLQFYPPVGGATIGAGTNLTSISTGNFVSLTCDTTAGVGINTSNHTIVAPNRNCASRPSSGAWDVGAYEFFSGVLNPTGGIVSGGIISGVRPQ